MTEGNIASWKVKEGDSFSAGDVLLEIETDKASMDVEAADDGVMFKILAKEGSKAIRVGTRIAVLAEQGDDPSSLELPPDDSKPISKPSGDKSEAAEGSKPSEPKEQGSTETPRPQKKSPASPPKGQGQNANYPLYPSVNALIHENQIPEDEVSKIPATGPNHRLLKGDVLAYLGRIEPDYSSKQSSRIEQLSHLDLSNVKVMKLEQMPAGPIPGVAPTIPETPPEAVVSISITLSEVLKVQKKIQDTLGVSVPLATFLARAVDIANDDLPKPKGAQPTSDELFNAVLGLNDLPTLSRGSYLPQIEAIPPAHALKSTLKLRPSQRPDIIDILTGRVGPTSRVRLRPAPVISAGSAPGHALNLFSLTVPLGEELRARTFLERMKTVLQVEPGRLIL